MDRLDVDRGSMEELHPPNESSSSSHSSWRLIRKLFKDSKGFSDSKKVRRFSEQQSHADINVSPSVLRKLSVPRQRKLSTGKQHHSKSRKFSAVNSQENLLHYFVTEADTSTLQKILQNKKVNINFMRPPGITALHTACALGDIDVVELLLQNGSDISIKTWSGISPLQITSIFGHFDVAQLLMKYGACPKDIQDGFNSDLKVLQTVLPYM